MTDQLVPVIATGTSATDGDVTVDVANRRLSGWTDVRISRGIERCPADFQVSLTELYPGEASSVSAQPGDPCQVLIGKDVVLTGYIDRYTLSIAPEGHSISMSGRGRCADLVDCSAEWPGFQISGANAQTIAATLAQPYGISVAASNDTGAVIPQFNLMFGETPWEVIERVCRYRALLAYEMPDGSLMLSRTGTKQAAGGIAEGSNVLRAAVRYSMDQRFSDYVCVAQAVATTGDPGLGEFHSVDVTDPEVTRHRLRYIIAEACAGGFEVVQRRAIWEKNRRAGRSVVVQVVVDSWRDESGALWAPNTLVDVTLPTCKLFPTQRWLIAQVDFHRGDMGTVAELVIMSPQAFDVQPIALPAKSDVPARTTP